MSPASYRAAPPRDSERQDSLATTVGPNRCHNGWAMPSLSAAATAVKEFLTPARVSENGLRAWDFVQAPFFRLAVLTSLAGTLGYFWADTVPSANAITAAITAMVSMRHTFHDSIRESVNQVVGVLLGGVVAYLTIKVIGFTPVVYFISILACFVVSRLLKLGEEGAVAIGITVVLVLAPSVSTDTIENRLLGVVIGGIIAMSLSYFVRSGTPQERALKAGIEQSRAMAALLHGIALKLSGDAPDVSREQAAKWLARAEIIAAEVARIRTNAESALAGAKWSPMIDRAEAQSIVKQIEMTAVTADTVVNICRELVLTFGKSQRLPELLATALAGILNATALVIEEQAEVAQDVPAAQADDELFEQKRDEAIAELKSIDETQPLFIGGSILRDAEKINDILGQ